MEDGKIPSVRTVKDRLEQFGYMAKDSDEGAIGWALGKARAYICTECSVEEVPEGLFFLCVDRAVGEFLQMKKTFAPGDLAGLDLFSAVQQLKEGDTTVAFAVGEGTQTDEQRLEAWIGKLLNGKKELLSCFRRLRW